MTAIPSFNATRFADAGFRAAREVFGDAAENFQTLTNSLVAGILDLERARAEVVAIGVRALQQQATEVGALRDAAGAKDVLALQQQFAVQMFDTHSATVRALGALAVAWSEAFRPLKERYAGAARVAFQL